MRSPFKIKTMRFIIYVLFIHLKIPAKAWLELCEIFRSPIISK